MYFNETVEMLRPYLQLLANRIVSLVEDN